MSMMFKMLINKRLPIEIQNVDIENQDEVLVEWKKISKQIENTLNRSEWKSSYVLKDKDGVDIESLEDFMVCLEDNIDDGVLILSLALRPNIGTENLMVRITTQ